MPIFLLASAPSFFSSFPGVILSLISISLIVGWVLMHVRPPIKSLGGYGIDTFCLRLLIGTLSLFMGFVALSAGITFATGWSWWALSFMGALAIESIISLYSREGSVVSKPIRISLITLRCAALILVLLILAEPVVEHYISRSLDRTVVILMDQSDSMEFSDPQRDVREWIDLGLFYGVLDKKDYGENGTKVENLNDLTVDDFFVSLEQEDRRNLENLRETKRSDIVARLLKGEGEELGLLDRLKKNYKIQLMSFASTPKRIELPAAVENEAGEVSEAEVDLVQEDRGEWKQLTNLTTALEYPLENIPPDQLAGVIILSDHRDTARGHPEAPVKQLASRSVPIYPVLIGSKNTPQNLAITWVDAPQSIFKGESLKAAVDLKMFGVPGENIKVNFLRGERVIDEKVITVPADDDRYETKITFRDSPEEGGILSYSVRIEERIGEKVVENNRWDFQTAVSEDRTNVLLVDSRPRWEFRYLRNLYYGRDKSVHLQYVLSQPDSISSKLDLELNIDVPPRIVASASRPFGNAEASALPETREEWRKFDIIILGDVSPEFLTPTQLAHIEYCVKERGAALIVIAGPTSMPHKFEDPSLERLLPVNFRKTNRTQFRSPEPSYRLVPTQFGRRHPIMQLGNSDSESDQVWVDLPLLNWRYQSQSVKPGATVLAYARPPEMQQNNMITADFDPQETANRIREMNEIQDRNSLLVFQPYGLGKVLMLNFDRTWRLRYRIGDTLHHRFWGKVATWGAGENLRAGNEFIRLGTDEINYQPTDKVKVTARVLQEDFTPVVNETFNVDVYRNGLKISTHALQYRDQSQGMYEAEIGPFTQSGIYPIRLVSSPNSKVKFEGDFVVETEFRVATSFNPVELSEFSVDTDTAEMIAQLSQTNLISLPNLGKLDEAFGPGSKKELERADITLWDHWLLFVLLVSLVTGEWILRRKGGLL